MKFLDNLTFGQYVPSESPIHHLDPRCKIACVLVLLTSIFMVRHTTSFIGWGLLLLVVTSFSRLPLRLVVKTAKPVLILALFTASIHIFFTKGTPVFSLGIITVTREGLRMAAFTALRLLFLVLFASFLTLTTKPMELADGLERLFSPLTRFGFPAHELAMMMTIALRFIPTLLEEADKIMKAQLARGADLESGNILQRSKAMVPILVPLFVSAFRRADELAMAMESRCYHGGEGRTRMHVLKFAPADACAAALTLGLIALIVAVQAIS